MRIDTYDALIVGARVAGSVVAALLGDAGYRVLLVDRATFPSPTLSTHFFRGSKTLAVLDRLGILESVLALGSPPLLWQYWYTDGAEQGAQLPYAPKDIGPIDYCLSVRRAPLDFMLLQRACSAPTVEFLEQTRTTSLVWEEGRVVGAGLMTPSGERRVQARIVVGADGRHSSVAREVDAPFEASDSPLRALYYRYVSNFPGPDGRRPDGAEFSVIEDEIAYVFPSDAGVTCIATSVNLDDYARLRKNLEQGFDEHIMRHPGIRPRLNASTREGPVLGCGPERNYIRVPSGPGWALVGDAGLHQDPVTGNGMDMAAVHATLLAEALVNWFSNRMSETAALAEYRQRRNDSGCEIYRETVNLARDLRQITLS